MHEETANLNPFIRGKHLDRDAPLRPADKFYIVAICLVIAAVGIVAWFVLTAQAESLESKYSNEIASLRAERDQAYADCESEVKALTQSYEAELSTIRETVSNQLDQISELEEQVSALTEALQTEQDHEFATLAKYWYLLRDVPSARGITIELIEYGDELCKEADMNPHIIWSIIEIESKYIATAHNPTTNARGLGQFIPGTGKYVYETLMKHGAGTYSHDMAYDPYLNVAMMVEYWKYLKANNSSTEAMIASYRGGYGQGYQAYWNEFTRNLTTAGSSSADLSYQ